MAAFDCIECGSSDIVKRGTRKNKLGEKQRFLCKDCNSSFIEPDGFEKMRHRKEDIVRAIHIHNDRLSLFKTQYHIWQHDGVKVTRKTISDWTKKYSNFLKSASPKGKTKTQRKAAF